MFIAIRILFDGRWHPRTEHQAMSEMTTDAVMIMVAL